MLQPSCSLCEASAYPSLTREPQAGTVWFPLLSHSCFPTPFIFPHPVCEYICNCSFQSLSGIDSIVSYCRVILMQFQIHHLTQQPLTQFKNKKYAISNVVSPSQHSFDCGSSLVFPCKLFFLLLSRMSLQF